MYLTWRDGWRIGNDNWTGHGRQQPMKRDGFDRPKDREKRKRDADTTIFATQGFEIEQKRVANDGGEEQSGGDTWEM
jgi:hypothetical protein